MENYRTIVTEEEKDETAPYGAKEKFWMVFCIN